MGTQVITNSVVVDISADLKSDIKEGTDPSQWMAAYMPCRHQLHMSGTLSSYMKTGDVLLTCLWCYLVMFSTHQLPPMGCE